MAFSKKITTRCLPVLLFAVAAISAPAQKGGKYDRQHRKNGWWRDSTGTDLAAEKPGKIIGEGFYDHGIKTGPWKETTFTGNDKGRYWQTGNYKAGRRDGWWLDSACANWDPQARLVEKIRFRDDTILETIGFAPENGYSRKPYRISSRRYLSTGGDSAFFYEYFTDSTEPEGKVLKLNWCSDYGILRELPRAGNDGVPGALRTHFEIHYGWKSCNVIDSFNRVNRVEYRRYLGNGELFLELIETGPYEYPWNANADSLHRYYFYENGERKYLASPDSAHPMEKSEYFLRQDGSGEILKSYCYNTGASGTWSSRSTRNDSLFAESWDSLRAGSRRGVRVTYFPSGSLKSKHVHVDGENFDTTYYDTGKVESTGLLKPDYSEHCNYYPNGKLKSKEIFDHGHLLHEEYDETGKITKQYGNSRGH